MRRLTGPSRRSFGQGVGVSLALTLLPRAGIAASEVPSEVAIRDFAFEPAEVIIKRGAKVRWTNLDIAPHTATSNEADWDTGALEQHESAEVTFTEAGTFRYFCAYHPHMKAVVRVEP